MTNVALTEMMMSEEDFLEHAGVKGMKWGVRREAKKIVKSETNAVRDKSITDARVRYEKSARSNYLNAKGNLKDIKRQKKTMDPVEYERAKVKAKAALEKVKAQNVADYELGSKNKSGAETAVAAAATTAVVLAAVASVALQAYAANA